MRLKRLNENTMLHDPKSRTNLILSACDSILITFGACNLAFRSLDVTISRFELNKRWEFTWPKIHQNTDQMKMYGALRYAQTTLAER